MCYKLQDLPCRAGTQHPFTSIFLATEQLTHLVVTHPHSSALSSSSGNFLVLLHFITALTYYCTKNCLKVTQLEQIDDDSAFSANRQLISQIIFPYSPCAIYRRSNEQAPQAISFDGSPKANCYISFDPP